MAMAHSMVQDGLVDGRLPRVQEGDVPVGKGPDAWLDTDVQALEDDLDVALETPSTASALQLGECDATAIVRVDTLEGQLDRTETHVHELLKGSEDVGALLVPLLHRDGSGDVAVQVAPSATSVTAEVDLVADMLELVPTCTVGVVLVHLAPSVQWQVVLLKQAPAQCQPSLLVGRTCQPLGRVPSVEPRGVGFGDDAATVAVQR
mmetsp:Transcript_11756/g.42045  ORF Transcript_11756/g.42045 Transcript_11756/m.42045 type:complete len:205 (-) Transcript_11756:1287-1901(-)